MHRWDLRITG